jgi:ABC-type polysaccharide/polyol phosphate export permease
LFAIVNVFFQDARHLAELGFGICFFLTPIIYPKERLAERGLGFVIDANPVVLFLDMIREPLLTGSPPAMAIVAKAFGVTFVAVVVAIAAYIRFEHRVIFHL